MPDGDRLKRWSWCVPAPLLHAMTCGRVRRWMTCVLHTVSDSGSCHAHTEGFCAFRLVGTRRSFRTFGVHHLEEVRATNLGYGVYVGAQANGARTIKERSVGHSWWRTSASSITRQTNLWRSWVDPSRSAGAARMTVKGGMPPLYGRQGQPGAVYNWHPSVSRL